MSAPYCYEYPRPAVTVDMAVFTLVGAEIRVLMIRRKHDPFAGHWAIPGGFLDLDEPPDRAALRELREETGLDHVEHVAPIGFFGAVDRDPRGRVISLAHVGVTRWPASTVQGADDASEAAWLEPGEIDQFAFDHKQMLAQALLWLVFQIQNGPVGLTLLSEEFTSADVKDLHQAIGGTPQAANAWRRRLEKSGGIAPVPGAKGRFRIVEETSEAPSHGAESVLSRP
jgi:8-oxo-dGTP diphosphatase